MATWGDFAAAESEFAERVRALFDAGTNKTLATLRRDGSPRISGSELVIEDSRAHLGMMPGSRKLADVERDPRFALHSPTLEPPAEPGAWAGEAKLAGTLLPVEQIGDGPPGSYFELDLTEVVLTALAPSADRLAIESWHPGRGYRRIERE